MGLFQRARVQHMLQRYPALDVGDTGEAQTCACRTGDHRVMGQGSRFELVSERWALCSLSLCTHTHAHARTPTCRSQRLAWELHQRQS
jgi:hypothetical protein